MQQVLEAPEMRDEQELIAIEDRPVLSPERSAAATETTRQPISLLRSILSVFTGSKPEDIPKEYGLMRERYDTPIDHLSRIDPCLCMRTISV
jgi:hypothetical protein